MIKLFSTNVLVRDRKGRHRPFNVDEIRSDLAESFAAAGVAEPWAAESISQVIEEYLCFRQDNAPAAEKLTLEDIDRLVVNVLVGAGYGDVGGHYRSRRGKPSVLPQGFAPGPWDEQRVRDLLRRQLPVVDEQADALAGVVSAKLAALGFPRVSDQLITDVALHAAFGSQEPDEPAPEPEHPQWLFAPEHWRDRMDRDLADAIASGCLAVFPVSRVLPVVRVGLDLDRLADGTGVDPLTELALFPALQQACSRLRRLLNCVRVELLKARPNARVHPARVAVHGLESVVGQRFGSLRDSQRLALSREITQIVRDDTARVADFPVVVSVES